MARNQEVLNEQQDQMITIPQHMGEWMVWVILMNTAVLLPFLKQSLVKLLPDSHFLSSVIHYFLKHDKRGNFI